MVKAAEAETQDGSTIEQCQTQAAVSSQNDRAVSEDLEDGELEEESGITANLSSGHLVGVSHTLATSCDVFPA